VRVYLDASVVVALVSDEAFSERAEQLLSRPDLVLIFSDFASAEATSALARRVRTGEMQPHHASIAFEQLDDWAARVPERAGPEPRDIAHAEAMIRSLDLSLRTPDAINLALALRVAEGLATFDRQLARAAEAKGLPVLS
jgi:predicted nucleic acid-binding protein